MSNKMLEMDSMNSKHGKKGSRGPKLVGKALFILSSTNPIRKACRVIVGNKFFDPFILFMIVLSTLLLTLENPLDNPNG